MKTAEVLPGLGAYLIVQRATQGGQLGEASESSAPAGDPVDPDGTLTAITYSYGKRTCKVIGDGNALGACGFSEGPLKGEAAPGRPRAAARPARGPRPHAHRRPPRLPRALRRDERSRGLLRLFVRMPRRPQRRRHPLRDVAKGAILHISIAPILSHACSRSGGHAVYYTRSIDDNVAPTALGKVTVHIPRGDHA